VFKGDADDDPRALLTRCESTRLGCFDKLIVSRQLVNLRIYTRLNVYGQLCPAISFVPLAVLQAVNVYKATLRFAGIKI
jgi:hypothetical protein